jgi:hypothetical protein
MVMFTSITSAAAAAVVAVVVVDTHHCPVDTLFHAYFFYVSFMLKTSRKARISDLQAVDLNNPALEYLSDLIPPTVSEISENYLRKSKYRSTSK